MENKLVSIITPCYNGEHCLFRLLDSVIAQTYRPIEFILVNDGSTDGTLKLAESYAEKFAEANIAYEIVSQENKGLGGAINAGLQHVHGDYFCWPDADDYLEPTSVENRVDAFREHPECGVVTSNAYIRKADDLTKAVSTLGHDPRFDEPKQFLHHLNGDSIFCSGCHMADTEKFRAVNPQMQIYPARRGQNWQLLLPMYYAYDRYFLDKPLYNYIVFPNSMSHGDDTFEKRLFRINEHLTILLETLSQMQMSEEERTKYMTDMETKYARLQLVLASEYRDVEIAKSAYTVLEKNNYVTLRDKFYLLDMQIGIIPQIRKIRSRIR